MKPTKGIIAAPVPMHEWSRIFDHAAWQMQCIKIHVDANRKEATKSLSEVSKSLSEVSKSLSEVGSRPQEKHNHKEPIRRGASGDELPQSIQASEMARYSCRNKVQSTGGGRYEVMHPGKLRTIIDQPDLSSRADRGRQMALLVSQPTPQPKKNN